MAVKDFMIRKVIYISPETTVAAAADLMREKGIHRLPVMENDRLVGLVTEGTIAEASPSKATSLSIYEMNYLLNKTKIKDVMIRDVITISRFDSLEDAAHIMITHKIGILPVVDGDQLFGIITDRDVMRAFLKVSSYGESGLRLRFHVKDEVGILATIVSLIAEAGYNIITTVQVPKDDGTEIIEIQLAQGADAEKLQVLFRNAGIELSDIQETQARS
ncbi:CBS domain-containing protein [Streptococcus sp. DD13]|uniref:CBS domain-containing protein n=1 Tax=Streptococcus sp. DD13 TaxID=1777881 RepID=UPI0007953136|nr:CBS domain-containing protein [Streptococcus sp. DD13]KXT78476.1 CBS domain protein [Streptococcus sp. DD13]